MIFGRRQAGILLLALGLLCSPSPWQQASAQTKTSSSKSSKAKAPAKKATSTKKRAPASKKPLTRSSKTTKVQRAKVRRRTTSAASRAAARRRAAAAAAAREKASATIAKQIGEPSNTFLEQPGALVPFFEQLYRQENRLGAGPVRILQYGDSHTAADVWTSAIRTSLQARFGDGGSGFSHAGSPWRGYRRFDVSGKASKRWQSAGLLGRASLRGDEFQGLSGVSVSTRYPKEWITLRANCSSLEVFYLQQPGGGRFLLYDKGELVAEHSTDGEYGPGILQIPATTAGEHEFRIETLDRAPVRLFGWVAENDTGVTYEPLGINGAQATIATRWNADLFAAYVARRDPALIVIAYGTNEAGHTAWNYESYYAEFDALLKRIRSASPTAAILVVGPPDRLTYVRRRGWRRAPRLDLVIRAQRAAAKANRVAFWDTHARMGGENSMRTWVQAGLAARDHVHFSASGYRRLGETLYQDLMVQYNEFQGLRRLWSAAGSEGTLHPESVGTDESTPRTHSATREEGFQEE